MKVGWVETRLSRAIRTIWVAVADAPAVSAGSHRAPIKTRRSFESTPGVAPPLALDVIEITDADVGSNAWNGGNDDRADQEKVDS